MCSTSLNLGVELQFMCSSCVQFGSLKIIDDTHTLPGPGSRLNCVCQPQSRAIQVDGLFYNFVGLLTVLLSDYGLNGSYVISSAWGCHEQLRFVSYLASPHMVGRSHLQAFLLGCAFERGLRSQGCANFPKTRPTPIYTRATIAQTAGRASFEQTGFPAL